jgi:hypothetical protein
VLNCNQNCNHSMKNRDTQRYSASIEIMELDPNDTPRNTKFWLEVLAPQGIGVQVPSSAPIQILTSHSGSIGNGWPFDFVPVPRKPRTNESLQIYSHSHRISIAML